MLSTELGFLVDEVCLATEVHSAYHSAVRRSATPSRLPPCLLDQFTKPIAERPYAEACQYMRDAVWYHSPAMRSLRGHASKIGTQLARGEPTLDLMLVSYYATADRLDEVWRGVLKAVLGDCPYAALVRMARGELRKEDGWGSDIEGFAKRIAAPVRPGTLA